MDEADEWKSKKLITVNYSSYIRLWLVNFLILQHHPLLLLLIVDHALLYCATFNFNVFNVFHLLLNLHRSIIKKLLLLIISSIF